jgi:hypothetical protein
MFIAAMSFAATWVEVFSRPLRPAFNDDGISRFEIHVLRIGPIDPAADLRINQRMEDINQWLGGSVRINIIQASAADNGWCGLTLMLSQDYPFSGRSGLTYSGCPITLINPVLADEWTVPDEIAHQLRGHVSVPHAPDAALIVDLWINLYMDESNFVWWLGLRWGFISFPLTD